MLLVVADLVHHLQQPEEESRIKAALPEVDLARATFGKQICFALSFHGTRRNSRLVASAFTEDKEEKMMADSAAF